MIFRSWICSLLVATSVFASVPAAMERAAREVIIKWRNMPARLDAGELLPNYSAQMEDFRAALPVRERTEQGLECICVLRATTRENARCIVSGLQSDPRVEYAELRPERHTDDYPVKGRGGSRLDGVPNDPFYSQQWALQAVDAEAAWDITRGDTSVVIAVVDVGVDFSHPDLTSQRWINWAEVNGQPGVDDDGNGYVDDLYGYDFVEGDGDPTPNPRIGNETHGTHVAGIAAATRNNGIGIAGLAPGCKIMAVRVGSGGSIFYGYDGIYYASRSGARVINCSWGGDSESGFERDVLDYAFSRGCVVVAAAGNDPTLNRGFPAATEGVLSTAASGMGDRAAGFTTRGPWVKVTAPGVAIYSTVIEPDGAHGYDYFSGTSMATPMAAATCALVASRFPNMNGRQIMDRVMLSADPIDAINSDLAGQLGLGRINAWRALSDSVAGVRLVGISYSEVGGDNDQHIRGSEQANLRISIYNDLADAGTVVAHVHTTSDSISINPDYCGFSDVLHGGPYVNSETSPVTIQVVGTAMRGPIIPFSVDFFGANQRLIGRGTVMVYLDSTFVVVDNGYQKLGFTENGSLGYFDYVRNQYIGPGWKVSDGTGALFLGSFFVAADGAVSDNFYGNEMDSTGKDFVDWLATPDSVAHAIQSSRADYEARASFDDRGAPEATRLFAQVESAGLGWYGPGVSGALVLEYKVTNPSVNAWTQTYAGFFLDVDLASAVGNLAGFDSQSDITYVRQIRPGHPIVGVVPITDTLGTLYVLDNRAQIDPGSWHDTTKWNLMTRGISGIPTQPMDLSLLVGVGPFILNGESSRTFAWALVSGQTVDALRAQADSARQRYVPRYMAPQSPPPAQRIAEQPRLFPNPLPQGESLQLLLPKAEPVDLRFYNLLGQSVAQLRGLRGSARAISLDRGMLNGASGLLFYRIETPSGHAAGKLLILK